jgi:hypothetical protein
MQDLWGALDTAVDGGPQNRTEQRAQNTELSIDIASTFEAGRFPSRCLNAVKSGVTSLPHLLPVHPARQGGRSSRCERSRPPPPSWFPSIRTSQAALCSPRIVLVPVLRKGKPRFSRKKKGKKKGNHTDLDSTLSNPSPPPPGSFLFSCFVILLFCCFLVLLFCCFVVLLFCCFVVLLFCCFSQAKGQGPDEATASEACPPWSKRKRLNGFIHPCPGGMGRVPGGEFLRGIDFCGTG